MTYIGDSWDAGYSQDSIVQQPLAPSQISLVATGFAAPFRPRNLTAITTASAPAPQLKASLRRPSLMPVHLQNMATVVAACHHHHPLISMEIPLKSPTLDQSPPRLLPSSHRRLQHDLCTRYVPTDFSPIPHLTPPSEPILRALPLIYPSLISLPLLFIAHDQRP